MKYKIGLILPDSNYYSRLGQDLRAMTDAGLAKAGCTDYELILEPGGYNADARIIKEKVQSLIIRDQVDVIIAPFNPYHLIDVAPLLASNEVILLLFFMGEDTIYHEYGSEFVFINTFNLSKSSWLHGHYAGNTYGVKGSSIGAIHDVGYGMTKTFSRAFESAGGKFTIATFTHQHARTESPLGPIQEIIKEQPDFVCAFYSGKEGVSFVDTWTDVEGDKPPVAGSYMMYADDILKACGPKLLGQQTIGCWDKDSDQKENQEFKKLFEEELGKTPHEYGLMAYENAQLLGLAILKTGSAKSPAELRDTLTKVSLDGPRGTVAFDPETRVVSTTDYLFEIQENDGEIIRKNLGMMECPAVFYEQLEWSVQNQEKEGWMNPYLIA